MWFSASSGNPVMGLGTAAMGGCWPIQLRSRAGPGRIPNVRYAASNTNGSASSVGYATSSAGITWRRDTVHSPVLTNGASGQRDNPYVVNARVIQIGNTWYLWYEGGSTSYRSIGVATSKDTGITWTKYASNPVLSLSPGTWYSTDVEPGSVLRREDTLDMWYDAQGFTWIGTVACINRYDGNSVKEYWKNPKRFPCNLIERRPSHFG